VLPRLLLLLLGVHLAAAVELAAEAAHPATTARCLSAPCRPSVVPGSSSNREEVLAALPNQLVVASITSTTSSSSNSCCSRRRGRIDSSSSSMHQGLAALLVQAQFAACRAGLTLFLELPLQAVRVETASTAAATTAAAAQAVQAVAKQGAGTLNQTALRERSQVLKIPGAVEVPAAAAARALAAALAAVTVTVVTPVTAAAW